MSLPAWRGRAEHVPHPLHDDATNEWVDANCYTDLWIELLHGLGLDPHPVLACALDLDFVADQWTFFKPDAEDLRRLYGIDLAEMTVYRSLADHCLAHIGGGRAVIAECDAYHLPDASSAHHRTHGKTTIGVVSIDPDAGSARYLHNAGCFMIGGKDYARIFGSDRGEDGGLPPYVETVRLSGVRRRDTGTLKHLSLDAARRHLARLPEGAPAEAFAGRFPADVRALSATDDAAVREAPSGGFDGYAFATLRQLGAAGALASRYLRWLDGTAGLDLGAAADAYAALSRNAKALVMKSARAVRAGRPLNAEPILEDLCRNWDRAVEARRAITGASGARRPGARVAP